jgi:hypothetical protein
MSNQNVLNLAWLGELELPYRIETSRAPASSRRLSIEIVGRCGVSMTGRDSSTTSHDSSMASHGASMTRREASMGGHAASMTSHRPSMASHGLSMAGHDISMAGRPSSMQGRGLSVAGHDFSINRRASSIDRRDRSRAGRGSAKGRYGFATTGCGLSRPGSVRQTRASSEPVLLTRSVDQSLARLFKAGKRRTNHSRRVVTPEANVNSIVATRRASVTTRSRR